MYKAIPATLTPLKLTSSITVISLVASVNLIEPPTATSAEIPETDNARALTFVTLGSITSAPLPT